MLAIYKDGITELDHASTRAALMDASTSQPQRLIVAIAFHTPAERASLRHAMAIEHIDFSFGEYPNGSTHPYYEGEDYPVFSMAYRELGTVIFFARRIIGILQAIKLNPAIVPAPVRGKPILGIAFTNGVPAIRTIDSYARSMAEDME